MQRLPLPTLTPAHAPPPHSTLSWLSYGALKGDWTVIVVNAVGTALQTLYVLMYLHFCPRKVDALPHPPLRRRTLPCWHCRRTS